MSVYVDNANLPYRHMKMCHMVADSTEELLTMADSIGVNRRWIQKEGTIHEHFDICLSKRILALKNGAVEITNKELGIMLRDRRQKKAYNDHSNK